MLHVFDKKPWSHAVVVSSEIGSVAISNLQCTQMHLARKQSTLCPNSMREKLLEALRVSGREPEQVETAKLQDASQPELMDSRQ